MSLDPDRELCPDGNCIGVIGPDGRCKECGRPSPLVTRDPRHVGMAEPAEDEESPADDRELCPDGSCTGVIGDDGRCTECGREREPLPSAPPSAAAEPGATDDDFDDRELCPDDTCIGLIGPDGRCGECGKPREGLPG